MNEQAFIDLISGRQQGPLPSLARFGLRCLSPIYASATRLRNAGYQLGVSAATEVDVPVISVGNITTGGTGKTPVVAFIVNRLVSAGHRPCILSRGYRSLDENGNDEKRLLDRLCPGVPHVQNPDRVTGAEQAIHNHEIDVLVLDDGFQHRRIARNVDLVLIDATNPFGHDYVLPRGLLREPINGLHRADVLVITRCDQVTESELGSIRNSLQPFGKPIVEIAFEPTSLVDVHGDEHDLASLVDHKIGAFCGIGNPKSFESLLATCGMNPEFFESFADHCEYGAEELNRLAALMKRHETTHVVCTEKDIVKLREIAAQVMALRIGVIAKRNEAALDVIEDALLSVV